MYRNSMNLILLGIISSCMLSCKQDTSVYTEIITEVYSVTEYSEDPKLGAIQFSDSYIYDEQGNEVQYRIYNPDGTLQGSEVKDFSESKTPPKSYFYDHRDHLISYYKIEYNEQDRISRKLGFDATNDELLRIEQFHYDNQGNRIAKEIRSADDKIQKIQNFSFDPYGNETSIAMINDKNEEYYKEIFEITSRDKDQKWLQRWGRVNGVPKTFTVKRKKTLKKISDK